MNLFCQVSDVLRRLLQVHTKGNFNLDACPHVLKLLGLIWDVQKECTCTGTNVPTRSAHPGNNHWTVPFFVAAVHAADVPNVRVRIESDAVYDL